MNRNLFEGSERYYSYSASSPNVNISNDRPATTVGSTSPTTRMRRFSLTHESACDPVAPHTTRRRNRKIAIANSPIGTNAMSAFAISTAPPTTTTTTAHATTGSSGRHVNTMHTTHTTHTIHTQSSNETRTTVTADRNFTGNEALLTGEKIEPSRWIHLNLTNPAATSYAHKASYSQEKEFPLLRSNASVPRKGLVRTRSTDRDVDVIKTPTPHQQYERAQRRSSYSGCFPSRMDVAANRNVDDETHMLESTGVTGSVALPSLGQPSRQAWERNRRTNSPTRTRVTTDFDQPRPSPRRTISPPAVTMAKTTPLKSAMLKPKSSSLHTTTTAGFQVDFTKFTQFNSSGITVQSNNSASNSSSHGSFGSLGPRERPVTVPCTPLTESRPPVLTLSARDTPSRRFQHPSPRSVSRSPDSLPAPPLPASTARDSWVVRSTPRDSRRLKSKTNEADEDCHFQLDQSAEPVARQRRARREGVARAQSVERFDRPSRPPLSTTSSSSSLDEQPTMRRNLRPILKTRTTTAAVAVEKPRESRANRFNDATNLTTANKSGQAEYLNHSFNLSLSGAMSVEPDSPEATRGRFEDEIATPAIFPAGKKLPANAVPNFAIPQSPVKQRNNKARARVATVDEVSENTIDDLLEFDQEPEDEIKPPTRTGQELYEYARQCEWDMVAQECCDCPWTAKYVCDLDGTTALHLAVISRANPVMRDGTLGESYRPAPLQLIEQLIMACPEAAIIRCSAKRYTPLSYASLVADTGYDMDDSGAMIEIILKHNPHSALVFTDDGFSAVDVHIISYSRLHQEKSEVYSHTGRSSTVVLRALLDANPSLALVRSYGNRVRGPVELLYRCNLNEFKEATGADIIQNEKTARLSRSLLKRHACSSVVSTLSDWWAWKWALLLLKMSTMVEEENDDDDNTEAVATPFSAVHAVSHLVGCPIPILALAIDAFPELARTRNPRPSRLNNCPLHEVCSWVTDDLVMNGDPFVVKRKRRAIAMLLEAFPKAARMTNNLGETPLQLAIETCTPWDSLEKLVKAFPKALALPRSMDHFQEDSPLCKAVAYHNDDVGSVGSNEDEWETDAIDAIEGMYPFMVAGVLSHVPERRNFAETLLKLEHEKGEHSKSRKIKDLESLRSIYGLLRAQPKTLEMFLEDEKNRRVEEKRKLAEKASVDDVGGDSCAEEETCTEAYVEDSHSPALAAMEDNEHASYEDAEEESYYTDEDVESEASDYTEIEEVSHL